MRLLERRSLYTTGGPTSLRASRSSYRQLIECAVGGHGSAWMANRLNRLGVPTSRAQSGWTATTVRNILVSEAQTGMIRVRFGGTNAWQPAKDQPVLVPRERWEEAQAPRCRRRRLA